jgi:magnesium-transporting ATPase (P-type)
VATEVSICGTDKSRILVLHTRQPLEASGAEDLGAGQVHTAAEKAATAPEFFWQNAETDMPAGDFSLADLQNRAVDHDLCVTGAVLGALLQTVPGVRAQLHRFAVFARMTPDRKEQVLLF